VVRGCAERQCAISRAYQCCVTGLPQRHPGPQRQPRLAEQQKHAAKPRLGLLAALRLRLGVWALVSG
jgi:hypothetical protein